MDNVLCGDARSFRATAISLPYWAWTGYRKRNSRERETARGLLSASPRGSRICPPARSYGETAAAWKLRARLRRGRSVALDDQRGDERCGKTRVGVGIVKWPRAV